jgi:hypothetical protein
VEKNVYFRFGTKECSTMAARPLPTTSRGVQLSRKDVRRSRLGETAFVPRSTIQRLTQHAVVQRMEKLVCFLSNTGRSTIKAVR